MEYNVDEEISITNFYFFHLFIATFLSNEEKGSWLGKKKSSVSGEAKKEKEKRSVFKRRELLSRQLPTQQPRQIPNLIGVTK